MDELSDRKVARRIFFVEDAEIIIQRFQIYLLEVARYGDMPMWPEKQSA